MSEIIVRHATASDHCALARLMTELGYPTSTAEIAARMEAIRDRTDYATFVADLAGIIAGMIGVSVSPSLYRSDLSGAIVALVVSSEFRDRGVGALLVNHGERGFSIAVPIVPRSIPARIAPAPIASIAGSATNILDCVLRKYFIAFRSRHCTYNDPLREEVAKLVFTTGMGRLQNGSFGFRKTRRPDVRRPCQLLDDGKAHLNARIN